MLRIISSGHGLRATLVFGWCGLISVTKPHHRTTRPNLDQEALAEGLLALTSMLKIEEAHWPMGE